MRELTSFACMGIAILLAGCGGGTSSRMSLAEESKQPVFQVIRENPNQALSRVEIESLQASGIRMTDAQREALSAITRN